MIKKILPILISATIFGISITANADDTYEAAAKIFPKDGEQIQPAPEPANAYAAQQNPPSLKSNYYIGVQLSGLGGSFTRNTSYAGTQNNSTIKPSSPSGSAGLIFGNGGTFSAFYVGWEIEALANYFKNSQQFITGDQSTNTTLSIPVTVNLDFRPGYLINNNVLLFALTGLNANYFKVTVGGTPGQTGTDKFSSCLAGWRFGLGADFLFNDTISLRGEYVYTTYFNTKHDFTDTNNIAYNNTFSIKNGNQFDIALLFHF